jgi:DNA-binding FrmR family transcriptional regulator
MISSVNGFLMMLDKRLLRDMIFSIPPQWGEGVAMRNVKTIARLKTIEGHVKGVTKMVENGEYCIDVIRQIQAVQSALSKVSVEILNEHLNSCVITAIKGEDVSERERVLIEIGEIYEQSIKV